MIEETEKQEDLPLELEIDTSGETSQETPDDIEIQETKEETKEEKTEDNDYSDRVQKRIKNLVNQRRESEAKAAEKDKELSDLKMRLARLEQGDTARQDQQFQSNYQSVKEKMQKAIEEGDTANQVQLAEQLADMRATVKVQELQRQQQLQQRTQSPTVGKAAQPQAPAKAMSWWQKNQWFNGSGFERETAAARAIDVQLDLEGFDKNSDEYYSTLDNRLRKMFPELISPEASVKTKPKSRSRQPIAPSAGGSSVNTGNRVQMTKDQLRMARELGLTDKQQLNAYASELRANTKEKS
tara:strand:+ start:3305 stop:4195 length:891 start_codon:yes stop_codon:yes gene_type:complete